MGTVYRAFDRKLQREVAVKVLDHIGAADHDARRRFMREAQALAALQHPNIVMIYHCGQSHNGDLYYSMELLDGESLGAFLQKAKTMRVDHFLSVFEQVTNGLAYAHDKDLIHRDIKPGNIMLSRDASGASSVKLIDLGIARFENPTPSTLETITASNTQIGSPAYMSPEQCKGQRASKASDIYSLGCVMYECLSGQHVFSADSALDFMYKHSSEQVQKLICSPRSSRGEALSLLIERCLSKEIAERPSAQQMHDELARIRKMDETGTCEFTTEAKPKQKVKSKARPIMMAAACLCLIFTVTWCVSRFATKEKAKIVETDQSSKVIALNQLKAEEDERLIKRLRQRLRTLEDREEKQECTEQLIDALIDCGAEQRSANDYSNSEKSHEAALALVNSLGADGVGRRAIILAEIASTKSKMGDYKAADKILDQAEKLTVKVWGDVHWRESDILFSHIDVDIHRRDFETLNKRLDQQFKLWNSVDRGSGIVSKLKGDYKESRRVRLGTEIGQLRTTIAASNLSPEEKKLVSQIFLKFANAYHDYDDDKKAGSIREYVKTSPELR